MSERHLHQDMTEAERRLSNVVMLGQVAELDAKKARVRVQAGPILTAWLPFATVRAGPDRTWHAPEAGEQVVLVAPGGDLNQAVVVGSLYRDAYPPPADQVKELLLPDGSSPYAAWFATLDAMAAAKVRVAVARMEQGDLSNVEWFRGIGEYKIDWGPGYRIYLAKDGLKLIVLLGGGSKKRQQKDIDEAVALWEDYKRRKAQTQKGA